MKAKKIKKADIDNKVEAINSLMQHWGWKTFAEIIMYFQGINVTKLFSKQFMQLDPVQKDKEHTAIVAVNSILSRLLELPDWLNKRKPEYWQDIVTYITEEANNAGSRKEG